MSIKNALIFELTGIDLRDPLDIAEDSIAWIKEHPAGSDRLGSDDLQVIKQKIEFWLKSSHLSIGMALREAVEVAKGGDDAMLFKLLGAYPEFAGAFWVHERVKRACMDEDGEFMQGYGKALVKPKKRREKIIRDVALRNLHDSPLGIRLPLSILKNLPDSPVHEKNQRNLALDCELIFSWDEYRKFPDRQRLLRRLQKRGVIPKDFKKKTLDKRIERLGLKLDKKVAT